MSEIENKFLQTLKANDFGEPFMQEIIIHPDHVKKIKIMLLAGVKDPYYHRNMPGQMAKSLTEGLPIFDDDVE